MKSLYLSTYSFINTIAEAICVISLLWRYICQGRICQGIILKCLDIRYIFLQLFSFQTNILCRVWHFENKYLTLFENFDWLVAIKLLTTLLASCHWRGMKCMITAVFSASLPQIVRLSKHRVRENDNWFEEIFNWRNH